MNIPFYKYQGAGNDFVIVNLFDESISTNWQPDIIRKLCNRRFGIGADGLMLLEPHAEYDFEMLYFNADGHPSSMCGNGGRCIVALAYKLQIIKQETRFLAPDGVHEAKVINPEWVELKMQDLSKIETGTDFHFLDTGSPHYVKSVENLAQLDVFTEGQKVRYSERFKAEGTNVNFVTGNFEGLEVRTYERGVEDETLACGTGVTAAAVAAVLKHGQGGAYEVPIKAKGGSLSIQLTFDGQKFTNIWLCGPAKFVFNGQITL